MPKIAECLEPELDICPDSLQTFLVGLREERMSADRLLADLRPTDGPVFAELRRRATRLREARQAFYDFIGEENPPVGQTE